MKLTKNPKQERNHAYDAAAAIAIAGFASALLSVAAVVFKVSSPTVCVIVAALIYTAAVIAILVYTRTVIKRTFHAGGDVPDSILRESVLGVSFPMLICEKTTGKVIWYNKESGVLSGGTSLFGVTLDRLSGITLDDTLAEDGAIGECQGHVYNIRGKAATSLGKTFVILSFNDITELKTVRDDAVARELAVMHIVADNLDELAENEKEKYRRASAEIASILSEWAASSNGVLKEYDHDRYLCFMEHRNLEENIQRKFDMLDRIRDLRVGDSTVPVTVSVGVANIGGSLVEKERAAKAALELALQRGGDQVVVKSEDATQFYGGKTRTVQKRTKVRARVFTSELLMQMSKSSSVMVMGHRFADFDCFGAAVGIARLAKFCGVPVHIVTDFGDSGMDGCRSIMMREKEYSGVFIDKGQALDMVDSDMLLVIVDVNNMALVESSELVDRCANVVIIDHHRKTAEFESEPLMTYIEPAAAATCELVAEMLEQCLPDDTLTVGEANMMLAGINLDTKQFTRNTGARTFGAALYLRDAGADPTDVQELFKTSLEDFTSEARFRSNVVVYKGMFAVALGEGEGTPADRITAAKAADKLLTVEGVKASFALVKLGGTVHISARSSGQVNVQLILEKLRGGGHFDSAGAQVEAGSMQEALGMLKGAIDDYVNNQ